LDQPRTVARNRYGNEDKSQKWRSQEGVRKNIRNAFRGRYPIMKSLLLSVFVLLFQLSNGQISITNQSLTDSSLGYLYIGVENVIVVSGLADNYTINISGGASSIRRLEKNKYVARVAAQTDNCQIIFLKGSKVIFKKEFKVRIVPDPIATINGLRDTSMKANSLLVNPFISVRLPGCFFRLNYSVYSFQAIFIQDTDSTTTSTNRASFSTEQIKFIKNSKSGDKIYFDNIRVSEPNGRLAKLSPFWIRIE
jgi:GldM C-terminal domain